MRGSHTNGNHSSNVHGVRRQCQDIARIQHLFGTSLDASKFHLIHISRTGGYIAPCYYSEEKYNLLPRRLRLERVAAMMPKMPPAAWPMAPMRDALFIIRHLWVVNPPGERLDPFINSAIFAFCAFRAQYFLRFDVEVESCFR